MSAPPSADGSLRYRILPVFLLLDITALGTGGAIATATVLPDVRDMWARQPALSDTLRLCVIDIGADAQVRLPLGDPLALAPKFPRLPARRGTLGSATLDTVRSVVETGVRTLGAEGFDVRRPLLFFMIGTAPDDTWHAGLKQLAASETRPVVVPCCFGPVDPGAVGASAAQAAFAVDPAAPPAVAVAALMAVLTAVLVRTGHGLGATGPVELPADDELPELVTHVWRTSPDRADRAP